MIWNTSLFLLLNAPAVPDPGALAAVRLLAASPGVIAPVLLVWLWVRRPGPGRAGLLAIVAAVCAGQAINIGLGLLWFEPRPFMAGVGHTLLAHAADNGFPSDHAALMFSLGAGLILTRTAPAIGAMTAVLGLGTGWARIWLGVHFPVDVLAAIPVGILAGGFARLVQPGLRRHALPPAARLYDQVLTSLRLPATMFPRDAP